ncbi:hypothetical protein [Archangium sp.]|jgi:hypothetical protein|uniref:hypothetical protein n=1 Tax=Archangium sp. TaxID=1872627 RepID=UPI00286C25D0|nr:hypothetical protein [Archangium sp.]
MMSWVWRMLLVVTVALVPGAFALLVAYVASRTLRARWRQAQLQSQSQGTRVSFRAVVATVEFKELVREARAAL